MAFIFFFRLLETLQIWRILAFFWIKIFPVRRLLPEEIAAARTVFADGQLFYEKIWVHPRSPIPRWFGAQGVASFRIIHLKREKESLALLIHELAHVAQFEAVGARYAPEALLAQWAHGHAAYDFEKDCCLADQFAQGRCFADLNREAQAQLVEAFFIEKTGRKRAARLAEFGPFLAEMRAGKW